VHLPLDENKRTKGIGFVQFMFPEHATAALQTLDGSSFQGRLLHVLQAKANQPSGESTGGECIALDMLMMMRRRRRRRRRRIASV
jgi:multiple RNA-binding domain-containing protein 1